MATSREVRYDITLMLDSRMSSSDIQDFAREFTASERKQYHFSPPVLHRNQKVCSGSDNEKTSDFYRTKELPERFEHPGLFKGYGRKPQHPMYMTESSKYGSRAPTVHTVPLCFHVKSQKFSQELGKCGMPRNYSLNTSVDKHFI